MTSYSLPHGLKNNLADDFQNLKVIVLKTVKVLLPMYKVSEKRKYVGETLSHFEICYKRERESIKYSHTAKSQ